MGIDIAAGEYQLQTNGSVVNGCYWERSAADGTVIANNLATAATSITVNVSPSDAIFTSQNCGTWILQLAAATPGTSTPRTVSRPTDLPPGFCTEAFDLVERVNAAYSADLTDPTAAGAAFHQVADALKAINAPQEIAPDWQALADGLGQVGDVLADTDFNDPGQAATAQQQIAQVEESLTPASSNVENYLSEGCGISD